MGLDAAKDNEAEGTRTSMRWWHEEKSRAAK